VLGHCLVWWFPLCRSWIGWQWISCRSSSQSVWFCRCAPSRVWLQCVWDSWWPGLRSHVSSTWITWTPWCCWTSRSWPTPCPWACWKCWTYLHFHCPTRTSSWRSGWLSKSRHSSNTPPPGLLCFQTRLTVLASRCSRRKLSRLSDPNCIWPCSSKSLGLSGIYPPGFGSLWSSTRFLWMRLHSFRIFVFSS